MKRKPEANSLLPLALQYFLAGTSLMCAAVAGYFGDKLVLGRSAYALGVKKPLLNRTMRLICVSSFIGGGGMALGSLFLNVIG